MNVLALLAAGSSVLSERLVSKGRVIGWLVGIFSGIVSSSFF